MITPLETLISSSYFSLIKGDKSTIFSTRKRSLELARDSREVSSDKRKAWRIDQATCFDPLVRHRKQQTGKNLFYCKIEIKKGSKTQKER